MSFNTWKKEFYPPITKVAKKNAAAHSLRKWIGLREANLAHHGLGILNDNIVHLDRRHITLLMIDQDSCALCQWSKGRWENVDCDLCEYKAHFGEGCDAPGQPYGRWIGGNDPEPMIKALRAIVNAKGDTK